MNMKYEELLLKMRPQDRFGQVQIDNVGLGCTLGQLWSSCWWLVLELGSVTDEAYLDMGFV